VTNEVILQVANADLPFGGVGESGYGRYHGFVGFKEFSNAKSCMIKNPTNFYPLNILKPPFS
jgi:aldehyde dehydrogenase (NAD+)